VSSDRLDLSFELAGSVGGNGLEDGELDSTEPVEQMFTSALSAGNWKRERRSTCDHRPGTTTCSEKLSRVSSVSWIGHTDLGTNVLNGSKGSIRS
jgi:hypothetical protein